jgi:PIN domain nuclease of toxin-antitoxin system
MNRAVVDTHALIWYLAFLGSVADPFDRMMIATSRAA